MGVQGVNVIVASGSPDGVLGVAACLRRDPNIQVVFTQAFEVDRIDPSKWGEGKKVGFIDLGVNNQNPNMTEEFVGKIKKSGHEILFIASEHGKEAWYKIVSKEGLTIKPKNRGEKYESSCAVLAKKAFQHSEDSHTKELLNDGNEADKMNYVGFGKIVNDALKSNPGDSMRRPYLANHLAFNSIPDNTIEKWINDGKVIEVNNSQILSTGKDLGDGIYLYDASIGLHNATEIFKEAYKTSHFVVLQNTKVFLDNKPLNGASIATDRKDINVLQTIQNAGINAGGIAVKANFAPEDLDRVVEAIRATLKDLKEL